MDPGLKLDCQGTPYCKIDGEMDDLFSGSDIVIIGVESDSRFLIQL